MAMRQPRPTGPRRPTGHQHPAVQSLYEDFTPISEWVQDQHADYLLIHLPGFSKEKLKVSVEGRSTIRVRGERFDIDGSKWQRFQEDFQVPEYCNLTGTRARFEDGMLTITVPRKSDAAASKPTQQQPSIPPPQKTQPAAEFPTEPKQPSVSPQRARREPSPDPKYQRDDLAHQKDEGKAGETTESDEAAAKGKAGKSEISEKSKGSSDEVEQSGDKSKLMKEDGVGSAREEKCEQAVPKAKRTTDASPASGFPPGFNQENLKPTVKGLADRGEERQLLVNAGVAVLVILALGTYIYYTNRE